MISHAKTVSLCLMGGVDWWLWWVAPLIAGSSPALRATNLHTRRRTNQCFYFVPYIDHHRERDFFIFTPWSVFGEKWQWTCNSQVVRLKILRFLVYQNTNIFSTFRPSSSVSHRRDISTFLDNLMVYIMKTIYFLDAYHLGWSSWAPGSPELPRPPWPPDHSLTPGSPGPPRQPSRARCRPVQLIG